MQLSGRLNCLKIVQQPSIKENSWIARVAAWKLGCSNVAIVIGRTIYLHNTSQQEFLANRRWVLHELKHLEQFKRYGMLKFLFFYLLESIRHGYTNNRFEIEARAAEQLQQPFDLAKCE